MQISQIFLTENNQKLPNLLQDRVDLIKAFYPEMKHVLYDMSSLRNFIEENFDNDVLATFDRLTPFAYKADLGRYCLLYILGGWYFDISIKLALKLNFNKDIKCIFYKDMSFDNFNIFGSSSPYAVSNAIIFSQNKNEIFQLAIEKVVENSKNKFYGDNCLCPTGPNLLGKVIAEIGSTRNCVFGDFLPLTPFHENKNLAFIYPNGFVHAYFKDKSLSDFGAQGVNNYAELYDLKNIYKN
jgi:mannosyltransferase OCH1-like enzyme